MHCAPPEFSLFSTRHSPNVKGSMTKMLQTVLTTLLFIISPLLLEMISNLHKKLNKSTEDLNEYEGIC